MPKKYTLNDFPDSEKPRERLVDLGADSLSLQELLALIIERGKADRTVLDISQELLSKFGSLSNLQEATIEELKQVKGIGFATACKLKACFEIGKRTETSLNHEKYGQKITCTKDLVDLTKKDFKNKKKEILKVVSLDSRNKILSIDKVSIGTINTNISHPREVFLSAIKNRSTSIILIHNHPSGEVKPSAGDIRNTKEIKETGEVVGIKLKDHIIISEDKYFSFLEENYL